MARRPGAVRSRQLVEAPTVALFSFRSLSFLSANPPQRPEAATVSADFLPARGRHGAFPQHIVGVLAEGLMKRRAFSIGSLLKWSRRSTFQVQRVCFRRQELSRGGLTRRPPAAPGNWPTARRRRDRAGSRS